MSCTLLKVCIFLAFPLFARARPQIQTHTDSHWVIGTRDDWASSGNYRIYSCGSQASNVKSILDFTYLYLQTAILSTDTPPYNAFFRTADPAPVTTVLHAITAGTNLTTLHHGLRRPALVCANAADPGIRTFWTMCQNSPETVLVQPPTTSIIFLCPIFFERPLSPTSNDCAAVNHAGTGLIPRTYIIGTQYGFLVKVLAEMYIRETMPMKAKLGGDVMDENACLALPPDQTVSSPSTYAYYVSSES